ncbi:hypothetical protein GRF29_164g1265473 [Pseudopithomyces chartarum]|uniref:Aminoglycoside phosphotransferase domain-containing protein n=1 Tax=Pseudopithomyces chartarum TaxID=1892770 RepID=A0AAN6LQI1_9PLEO|nr:hypothetical protein GRF29_164g1265473 [Pseudopithomyces chartarum]
MGSYCSSCFHRKPKRAKSQLPGDQSDSQQSDGSPLDIDPVQAGEIQNGDHLSTTNALFEPSTSQNRTETPESTLSAQSSSHDEDRFGSSMSGGTSGAQISSVTNPNGDSADLRMGSETEQKHSIAPPVLGKATEGSSSHIGGKDLPRKHPDGYKATKITTSVIDYPEYAPVAVRETPNIDAAPTDTEAILLNHGPHATFNGHSTEPAMEPETTDCEERKDWRTIRNIRENKFESLVASVLVEATGSIIERCTVFGSREGAYHRAVIVSVIREQTLERYIVRIPAHGVESAWTEEDKAVLRGEVELLRQIYYNTNAPVSNVIAYNEELHHPNPDQDLGAPWMIIQYLPGKSAYDIWFDQPYKRKTAYLTADAPSAETHRKRVNFLISLAKHMVEIQKLEFGAIGMPKIHFPCDVQGEVTNADYTTVVESTFHWPYTNDMHAVVRRGPFASTQAYVQPQWKHWYEKICRYEDTFYPDEDDEPRTIEELKSIGIAKILRMVFETAPFNIPSETFTIHHKDLDLQNILTDDDGFVTGIIDWDGAFAAPRCIGATAVPKWLMHDWFPPREVSHCLGVRPHMAWSTEYYRKIYAAAIYAAELKNGATPDAMYTSKSPIYLSALSALYEGGIDSDFAEKIIRRIPNLTADPEGLMILLGHGWPAAEKMLRERIAKLCEPELPDVNFMRDLGFDLVELGLVEGDVGEACAEAKVGLGDEQHALEKLGRGDEQRINTNEQIGLLQGLLSVDGANMRSFLANNMDGLLEIDSWNLVFGLKVSPTE